VGGGDDSSDVEDDIVGTAINIIRSEAVLSVKDRVFGVFRETTSTVFSKVTSREDRQQVEEYNLEILEDPDQEIKVVEKGDETSPFRSVETEAGTIIELNLDAFQGAERDKILSKLVDTYEEQGRLLTHEQELEFEVVEEANQSAKNKEILNHFEEYLSPTQYKVLRRSLSIRTAWEMDDVYVPSEDIRKWKRDLRRKFGESASTVANFCSSGYYDKDGVLREIMSEVAEEFDEERRIEDVYDQIISDEPFVVYVGEGNDAWGRSVALRNKLKKYDTYPYSIPFVDLRAQGYQNKENAARAMEILRQDLSKIQYEELHPEYELVYRIDPSTIEGTND
jgi:hypothetical protein